MGLGDTDPCGDVGVGLMSRVVNRRLFVESLAEALELELKPLPPVTNSEPGEREWLFDAALLTIKNHLAPNLTSDEAARRSRSVSRILKYLRDEERLAPAHRDRERRALVEFLGGAQVHYA